MDTLHSKWALELSGLQQPTPIKVGSLIDAERREWKDVMVNEMFQAEEASMILTFPLNRKSVPDKLIWRDSVVRIFSIKSAYFKAQECSGKENNP